MVRAKRISLFLCGLIASLACLQATPVHAAESASSTVSTSVDASYTVTVDKTQTISESDYDTYKSRGYYSFTARVSDYDIAYGSELVIKSTYDNQVWSSDGKDSMTAVLPSGSYLLMDYVSGANYTGFTTLPIVCGLPQDLSAGTWSTTISLDARTIDLNTLEPGLYGGVLDSDSTNKTSSSFGQAYSWDELLKLGYINVTDGVFTSNLSANMSNIYNTTMGNGESMILVMDDSVKQVGNGTDPLSYCGKCIVLPDSACTIADKAFYNADGLDIYFNGCTSIGASSFYGSDFNKTGCLCDYDGDTSLSSTDNLYKLYMPNVTTIKDNAFYGATGIYGFVADESLDYIDWNAFHSSDIRKVDLRAASSTLTVNVNAFTNCSNATIYLPDDFVLASPVTIGNHHFSSAGIYSGVSKVVYSGSSHTLADLQTLGGGALPTFEDALGNTITE